MVKLLKRVDSADHALFSLRLHQLELFIDFDSKQKPRTFVLCLFDLSIRSLAEMLANFVIRNLCVISCTVLAIFWFLLKGCNRVEHSFAHRIKLKSVSNHAVVLCCEMLQLLADRPGFLGFSRLFVRLINRALCVYYKDQNKLWTYRLRAKSRIRFLLAFVVAKSWP